MAFAILASLAVPADAASRKIKQLTEATSKHRGSPEAPFGDMPKGPLQLVVSLGQQHVTLYSNGQRIAQAPVSSGTASRATPTGLFSIIEKDRWHRSNLYDNAPMFFMHRLTWSGVAMHEGALPGFPASHGCIRLPREFAARLWAVSKLGIRVVVARNDLTPHDFEHPRLFVRKEKPAEPPVSPEVPFDTLRPSISELNVPPAQPIRLTWTVEATPAVAAQADAAPKTPEPPKPAPAQKAAEAPKRSGQVAVFVSRKEKKIFVRQGFMPLFDMPIEITNPDQPLGTHVFTALELKADGSQMRWNAITMPPEEPRGADRTAKPRKNKAGRGAQPTPPQTAEAKPGEMAAQALERIQFPPEALERIGEVLIPGSSLIISDYGLGTETGRYTEFIVVTR
jgi:hypothetical protein